MSKGLFDCKRCKQAVILYPPLNKRMGANGPMTRDEAMFLFCESRGGMCSKCYVEHRSEQPPPPPVLQNLTLEGLRDHMRGYSIDSKGEHVPFRAVKGWEPVV